MTMHRLAWKTKGLAAFLAIIMLFTVLSVPVSALDLENLLRDKVISVLRGQAEKAITYGNYTQKLLKSNNFQNEAEKRAYYQNKELAVKNKIQLNTQNIYNKFDLLITKNVDKVITPDSHWSLQFVGGALEGIPKGILELGVLGYNVYERGKTGNLYATSVNTYYKLKDNQDTYKELGSYIVSHPLQAGGAVAGVLFNEGKNYALTLYHNPRAAGNLAGSFVGIGGLIGAAGKGLKAVNKGLPAAARALESVSTLRVPSMGATPVAVGTAAKASKIEYRCPTLTAPKLTMETKRAGKTNLAGNADIARKAGDAGKTAATQTSVSARREFPSGRISGMEVVKFLAEEGFQLTRIKGSHYIMKGENGRVVSIPVHGSTNVAPRTITEIKKAAGYR